VILLYHDLKKIAKCDIIGTLGLIILKMNKRAARFF